MRKPLVVSAIVAAAAIGLFFLYEVIFGGQPLPNVQ
jgi:hypothetical protein